MNAPTPLDLEPSNDGFLRDEQGAKSSGRMLLWIELAVIVLQSSATIGLELKVDQAIWALHGAIVTALICWVGGARIAQYVGPQLGAVVNAVGQARRDVREPSKFDDHRDDSPR